MTDLKGKTLDELYELHACTIRELGFSTDMDEIDAVNARLEAIDDAIRELKS